MEMKIPKYVQKLIDRRCKLADQLATMCWELDEWLDKNNIECESCDTHTGVEIYCNPRSSKSRIMKAIADHPTEKGGEGEMKYYWFEFADGYKCCVAGMSKQELRIEESKHGKLLRKVEA